MEDERAVLADLDQLGEVFLVLLRVDVRRRVVAEHAEVAVDVEVDRRRLDRVVAERVDDDATGRELFPDGDVGQDHGGEPIGAANAWAGSVVAAEVDVAEVEAVAGAVAGVGREVGRQRGGEVRERQGLQPHLARDR